MSFFLRTQDLLDAWNAVRAMDERLGVPIYPKHHSMAHAIYRSNKSKQNGNELNNGCTGGWADGRTSGGQASGRANERAGKRKGGCADGRADEREQRRGWVREVNFDFVAVAL